MTVKVSTDIYCFKSNLGNSLILIMNLFPVYQYIDKDFIKIWYLAVSHILPNEEEGKMLHMCFQLSFGCKKLSHFSTNLQILHLTNCYFQFRHIRCNQNCQNQPWELQWFKKKLCCCLWETCIIQNDINI